MAKRILDRQVSDALYHGDVLFADTGYVIPTLGTRARTLAKSLQSVLDAKVGAVVVVAPSEALDDLRSTFLDPRVIFCIDRCEGLPRAINDGMSALPDTVKFVNWLGDDDVLVSQNLTHLRGTLLRFNSASLAFGKCTYVDGSGIAVFQTHARRIHLPLMRFGPQLISQPATLFRRDHFNEVGMLNTHLRYAFDLDLFIRLSKIGSFHPVPNLCAYFGWHDESLSVAARSTAAQEASSVRLSHCHPDFRWLMQPYEQILRRVITVAGLLVTFRSRHLR